MKHLKVIMCAMLCVLLVGLFVGPVSAGTSDLEPECNLDFTKPYTTETSEKTWVVSQADRPNECYVMSICVTKYVTIDPFNTSVNEAVPGTSPKELVDYISSDMV